MRYFQNEKERLINNYYNDYSDNYDTDHAFTKLVLSKGDKWLRFLLNRISLAKLPKPPFVYVVEDTKIVKAYLSYVSSRNSYRYITPTKMYYYNRLKAEPDLYIEKGSIDLRTVGLYEPSDLDSLMESNWFYQVRLKDIKYYSKIATKQRFLNLAIKSMKTYKRESEQINKSVNVK